MINITYTGTGEIVTDNNLDAWADRIVIEHGSHDEINIEVGSGIMIDMLRVLIKRGTISTNDINFYTAAGERVGPDHSGNLKWPIGFADKSDKLLNELLGC